jgi:hypothetical protein
MTRSIKPIYIFIKAEISKNERNRLKSKAALAGMTSQKLVGSLIRRFLNQ